MRLAETSIELREYVPGDRAACLDAFESNVAEFFVPAERAAFAAFLDALPGPYFVVTDEAGVVVGCGGYALREGTATADLCWGMVARAHHGNGLGRRLTEARLERIRADASIEEVALDTSQHTTGAPCPS